MALARSMGNNRHAKQQPASANASLARRWARLGVEQLESRLTPSNLVTAFYQELLNRTPDAGGAAGFDAQLSAGVPAASVAYEIENAGSEYHFDLVQTYYQHFLHRQASTAEALAWASLMASGLTDEAAEAQFVGSAEYYQLHGGTNLNWVNACYQDLLGRPDTDGAWLASVNAGTSRAAVALAIMFDGGKEFAYDQVSAYYLKFLGRSAVGDPGLAFFAGQLQSGGLSNEQIIAALLGSGEFAARVSPGSLTVSPSALPAATANGAYSASVGATGGSGTYSFAITAGSLPSWLSLNTNTGALSGTPTTTGTSSFTITATDSQIGLLGSMPYTLAVNAASSLTVSPAALGSELGIVGLELGALARVDRLSVARLSGAAAIKGC